MAARTGKFQFQGLTVDKNLRTRTVYVTDRFGNLIRSVVVESYLEADIMGNPYVKNWREQYLSNLLRPGQYILCDDGYVVKVTAVSYAFKKRSITLETGHWAFPKMTEERFPSFLNDMIITTNPRPDEGKNPELSVAENTLSVISDRIMKYRKLAVNYLKSFDRDKAYEETFGDAKPGTGVRSKNTIFRDHNFRYVLMSESTRYFEKAGVPPEVILRMVNQKVAQDGDVEQHIKWMELYGRMHPDMELKDKDGRRHGIGDGSGGGDTNLFLGEQQIVQQITDGAKGGSTNSNGKDKALPPSPNSEEEGFVHVDDEVIVETPDMEDDDAQRNEG